MRSLLLSTLLASATAFQTSVGVAFRTSSSRTSAASVGVRMSSSSKAAAESTSSTSSPSTTTNIIKFAQPDRVVRDELPVLYVYDHCPFCVRVRVALGIKNVKHIVHFMANDDIATPTNLVGKKIAPIFEWKEDNVCMAESMDIVNLVDADERFGPTNVIAPATGRTDLKAWQSSVRDLLRGLQRPRYVATGLIPEFQQRDGRHAFIKNHQMVGYSKDEWKNGDMEMEEKLKIYAEAFAKDPAGDVEELNRKLIELDDIVHCEYHVSKVGICMDDIDLFSRLRSITIIKDVDWPVKLRSYMDYMAEELCDVPLYDAMAL